VTAPSIRGYYAGDSGWTVAPVAGDTIYMFQGPQDYYNAARTYPLNTTLFPTVRSTNFWSLLAVRTASGTSSDTPAVGNQSAIGICVYGTSGEEYSTAWQNGQLNGSPPASININGGAALSASDHLLVVVKAGSALSYDGVGEVYVSTAPTTPTGMTLRESNSSYLDAGAPYGHNQTAALFTKQLSSTANPGPITSTFSNSAAWGAWNESHMAILIKGTSAVTSNRVGLGISRY
jgi:hypothetical protein